MIISIFSKFRATKTSGKNIIECMIYVLEKILDLHKFRYLSIILNFIGDKQNCFYKTSYIYLNAASASNLLKYTHLRYYCHSPNSVQRNLEKTSVGS